MNGESAKSRTFEDRLAIMLNDCSIDRLMAIDKDWKIIAWNKTSELLSGRKANEVIGMHLLDAFPELSVEEETLKAIETAMRGYKTFLPAARSGFNRINLENHFIPLQECGADIEGVMNIIHDVAHRVKAEQQLHRLNLALEKKYQQLERTSAELATYTYVTSRDIKEPLRQLYTGLEYLVKTEGRAFSDMGRANLRKMQSSLNRMNLLVDDILSLSGIDGSGFEQEDVDLNDVVAEVLEKLEARIAETSALVEKDELPTIRANRQMMKTLFFQLLDNAIKFQPEGNVPRVHISAKLVQPASADKLNPYDVLELKVADNGIGFANEDAERMFNMFEKLQEPGAYRGSGMGLTICRKIVQAHDGTIRAVGDPGHGAELIVHLPISGEIA